MKIESSKTYRVIKWTATSDADLGRLPGSDVKRLLAGYTYDESMELWFSAKAKVGYEVTEVA